MSGDSRIKAGGHHQFSLQRWSCNTCRVRKIRCDRRTPCGNCCRFEGSKCVFSTQRQAPRVRSDGTTHKRARVGRLSRLEMIADRLSAELTCTAGAGKDVSCGINIPASQQASHIGLTPNVLHRFQPRPPDIASLWKIYLVNIEPIIKLFHVPTMGFLVDQARIDPSQMNGDNGALILAICYTSIVSMDDSSVSTSVTRNSSCSSYGRFKAISVSRDPRYWPSTGLPWKKS